MQVTITNIEKNKSEFIHVELSEFSGYDLVGLRVYVNREGEDPTPTRKGLSCNVKLLPELKHAIVEAEQAAILILELRISVGSLLAARRS
jgi:hypothetical protein